MTNGTADPQPWQWPEEHWRKIVNQVRAGKPYRPASWPDGARCAVALSFDSDHETNWLRDGASHSGGCHGGSMEAELLSHEYSGYSASRCKNQLLRSCSRRFAAWG